MALITADISFETRELDYICGILEQHNEAYVVKIVRAAKAELDTSRSKLTELTGLLKDLEWSQGETSAIGPFCPCCMWSRANGHHADCRLAKALRDE